LIWDPPVKGRIESADDSDCYAMTVDPRQSLTVTTAMENSDARPQIRIFGPSGAQLALALASTPGQPALLQSLPLGAGTYRVEINDANGNVTNYTTESVLNAGLETSLVGIGNNTIATAQNIDSSFLTLSGNASRGALLGTTRPDDPDYFVFNAAAGDGIMVGATGLSRGRVDVAIVDGGDSILASSTAAINVDRVIPAYTVPASGLVYVRVSSRAPMEYSLIVTRNAAFDVERDRNIPTIVTLDGNAVALGEVRSTGPRPDEDFYSFRADAGDTLDFSLAPFADGPGLFINDLEPRVALLDGNGTVVAEGAHAGDGRNQRVVMTVPDGSAGTYQVRVSANRGTRGEYLLIRDRVK
jgi:hypothetical protein